MGYNDLSESGMTADERRAEATRIVGMIEKAMLLDHERIFVNKIRDTRSSVSTKQLFWLRDLKDKYE